MDRGDEKSAVAHRRPCVSALFIQLGVAATPLLAGASGIGRERGNAAVTRWGDRGQLTTRVSLWTSALACGLLAGGLCLDQFGNLHRGLEFPGLGEVVEG